MIEGAFEHPCRDALLVQPGLQILDVTLERGRRQPAPEELHERLLLIDGDCHRRTHIARDDQGRAHTFGVRDDIQVMEMNWHEDLSFSRFFRLVQHGKSLRVRCHKLALSQKGLSAPTLAITTKHVVLVAIEAALSIECFLQTASSAMNPNLGGG